MDNLKELAKTDKYLFHGSITKGLTELEPRQAHNFEKPDGKPAIFATDRLEDAIFKSLVSIAQKNIKGHSKSGWYDQNKKTYYYLSSNIKEYLEKNKPTGTVYVLNKSDFKTEKRGYISEKPVKIIAAAEVTLNDLPKYEIKEYGS